MNDSNDDFSLPIGGAVVSRWKGYSQVPGYFENCFARASGRSCSEGTHDGSHASRCGGGLTAAARGHQAGILKWRLARPGAAEGSWDSLASDLLPPVRSGHPLAVLEVPRAFLLLFILGETLPSGLLLFFLMEQLNMQCISWASWW